MHIPVLLKETIELLKPEKGNFFIDGTIDGGGHAAAILDRIMPDGMFLGVDLNALMLKQAEERIAANPNFKFLISKRIFLVHGNYADLPKVLERVREADPSIPLRADGLLLDLGFSSEQLESSGRGFSFKKDEPLLMTYDDSEKPVKEILKEIDERKLADVIYEFSGERFSRRIAAAIKTRERKSPIETTGELNEIIKSALPRNYERGRIEPATRTFQALRIYVNHELENLESVLKKIMKIVKSGGRIAIISFHSLEDRIVKKHFKRMAREKKIEIVTPKPVRPTKEESLNNPRSRSAMLRAAIVR